MLQELYWQRLQENTLPSEADTIKFGTQFLSEHSWYKHLSWTDPTLFIFFISPSTGEWSYTNPQKYHSERDWFNEGEVEDESELITDKNHHSYYLPPDLAERGSIMLTAFIHKSFETYDNEDFKSKHDVLKTELFQKLFEILEYITLTITNLNLPSK